MTERDRQTRAETIMGEGAYAQQVRRKARAKQLGSKASAIETTKRIGEYKKRNSRKSARKKPLHNSKRI